MQLMIVPRHCLCVLALALLVTPLAAQLTDLKEQRPFDEVVREYRALLQRPSLHKRTVGREILAATRDPRALEVLMQSYRNPEEPKQVNRYLIASITMATFGVEANPAMLAEWRDRNDQTTDSWLWLETLSPKASSRFDLIRDIVLDEKDPFLRAAALVAIADYIEDNDAPDGLPELCGLMLGDLPRKDTDRALQIESVAGVLLAMKAKLREEPWKSVCRTLIAQFDDEDTPQRTKVVIARYLTDAFQVPNLGLSSRWWLSELDRQPTQAKQTGETTTVPFFSVRTIGYRFVYVIDASDSMLERVTDREKKDLGPTTGGEKPKEGEPGFVPGEDDIDWSRVITRFDAAQEYLRLSLLSLNENHEFAVVLFGDEAIPLGATPRLTPATKSNVRKALAELASIEAGPVTPRRPNGTLRGGTNVYAGFRAAFEMTDKGPTRRESYVDAKALFGGCDTIFMLSDGDPSWDDFAETDSRDPGDEAGDPELGTRTEGTPQLNFWGPYGHPGGFYLVSDLRRLNMFRRAEIHCVGIGEANHRLLEQFADIGQGQAVKVEGERGR